MFLLFLDRGSGREIRQVADRWGEVGKVARNRAL